MTGRRSRQAIDESRPGAAALDLQQAFAFAEQVRRLHARRAGDVVYMGPGRVSEEGTAAADSRRLRVIPVEAGADQQRRPDACRTAPLASGSRSMGRFRLGSQLRNIARERTPLAVQFGGAPIANKAIVVPAAKDGRVFFPFRTKAAGWVEARLLEKDSIAEDNRAVLEIPALKTAKVAVFTNEPDTLTSGVASASAD